MLQVIISNVRIYEKSKMPFHFVKTGGILQNLLDIAFISYHISFEMKKWRNKLKSLKSLSLSQFRWS